MPKDKNENEPSAPFAPVSGYATAVDAAVDWFANPNADAHAVAKAIGYEGWPHAAYINMRAGGILVDELHRLRAQSEKLRAAYNATEELKLEAERQCDEWMARAKSHNNEAHPRREAEGGAK